MANESQRQFTSKEAAGLSGVLLAVIASVFAAWQAAAASDQVSVAMEAELRQKQQFTIEHVLPTWNTETARRKDAIEKRYPGLYNEERFGLLCAEEARLLYFARIDRDRANYAVRQEIVQLLNYFEFISVVNRTNTVDRAMLGGYVSGPMKRWRKALASFLRLYNEERGTCVWRPYEEFVETLDHTLAACEGFGEDDS